MIKRIIYSILVIANPVFAYDVELYTLSTLPFNESKIDVCYIDDSQNIITGINVKLAQAADEDIDSLLNINVIQKIEKSILCRAKAASLNITKVPAIVVDGKFVVYGERNINNALSLIKRINNG